MKRLQIYRILSVMVRIILIVGMTGFSPESAARADVLPNTQFSALKNISHSMGDAKNLPSARAQVSGAPQIPPTEDGYKLQWYLYDTWGINAETAWRITTGSPNVVVAVIDSGITNHVEFSGRTVPGYDFVSNIWAANDNDRGDDPNSDRDDDPSDPGDWVPAGIWCPKVTDSKWHGTHVAGIIGASANNFYGGAGINWNSKILPVRVSGRCGPEEQDIIDGMLWAAGLDVAGAPKNNNPAKVLNVSIGKTGACSSKFQDAINRINATGAVIVVATNDSWSDANNTHPGNCPGVITVAATNRNGNRAYYSGYGSTVEISAPGGEVETYKNGIFSTVDLGKEYPKMDGYNYKEGVSFSAPQVSGVVSLLFSLNPFLTRAKMVEILRSTAKPFSSGDILQCTLFGFDCACTIYTCGAGILNAGAAVKYVREHTGTGLDCGRVSHTGVIFYEDSNCNKDTSGKTKIFTDPTNWVSFSDFNDVTSSIFISPGWSAKVYENTEYNRNGGSWRCITGSMWDLSKDYFTHGNTDQTINNTISSIQVFNNSNCISQSTGYKLPWLSTSPKFYVWGDGSTHAMVQSVPRHSYDFGTYYGTTLVAMKAGTVVTTAQNVSGGGHLIVIDTNDGFCSAYLHLSEILVSQGSAVIQGNTIGKSGKSSNGNVHTHIAVYVRSGSSCTGYGSDYTKMHEVPVYFDEIGREPKRGDFLLSHNVPANKPPSISFSSANGSAFPSGVIYSRTTSWTFAGSASDPEGQLNRVEWRCSGDGCSSGSQTAQGTSSWTYTRSGMSGRNDVYFMAYDIYGNNTLSRHLQLNIDLAAPTTTPSLNGQSNAAQWSTWYTAPVNVNLHATDKGTGNATVGMMRDSVGSGKIHYRLNGGAWQVISGSDTSFTVSSDGSHTVEYYSEDALGNTEAARSIGFKIDQTPPSLPVNLQETHGLVSDGWQKDQNIPAFIWDAATDATSGIFGYQFYFDDDPNQPKSNKKEILASAPRQLTPFPEGLPTGTSYLHARTQDNAGNWSPWATLFIFRYDNTPPENPLDVTHAEGITTSWQNATSAADFSWSTAHDEGSGIKGYHVYWGSQADATSTTFITADAYQDLAPLCVGVCTGYLRLRSEDIVGNLAEDWNTVFILRYDNVAPLVDFSFKEEDSTNQTQVTLQITSSDEGSGVYAARFSADGQNWTEWEEPVDERLWNIPPISRQSWPVYAQVKDGVGLLSEIARHDVYLDVNPAQPSSLNYRLFDHSLSGGSGAYGSTNYSGRGTLSQVADSPSAASAHYTLWNGYEAGSQSIPLIVPGHEEYDSAGGSFTSGVVSAPLESANYRMILTVGEIGLPPTTTINSASYQHQPGFLAGIRPEQLEPPADPQPIVQIEMPAPDLEPLPTCDAPSISINDGALYTDNPNAMLSLCAPYAVETMISDREDFAGAVWEPFGFTRSWVIPALGSTVEPHFVYAQFKDADGKIYAAYFDDILYDPNQPSGSLLLSDDIVAPASQVSAAQMNVMGASASALTLPTSSTSSPTLEIAADGSVTLYIDGYDDNSGVTQMQLSADANFTAAVWQPFSPKVSYMPEGENGPKTVYARFQDDAGNISGTTTIDFIYDTQPPLGYVYADPSVLPGDAVAVRLYLGDYGTWDETYDGETPPAPTFDGGAVEMRLGSDPDLLNAYWEPLTDSVTLAIDPSQPEDAFYAQYRDAAGNVSEISSATYQIDTLAPDLSAMAEPGDGSDRVINIYANDDLSGVANLYLSNDPLMEQNVATQAYTDTLTWTFDDNKVLWIVAEDGVGNRTEPYPVYATYITLPVSEVVISGNAGVDGATLSYTDGTAQTTTADSSGNYAIIVSSNWTGTVTPSKTGYIFSPASREYSGISSDQVSQDYTATQNEYSLTINKVGNGTVTADKSAPYLNGSAVQLTAAADVGWTFTGWSGDCSGAGACNVTMDGNKSVTATFTKNAHTLTINKIGSGSVTPDLPAPYYHGDVVQLSATADTGWTFTGWSGACSGNLACTVTMNSDQSITATFTQNVHTLTINTSGNGTVTADKPAPYHYGDIVHLTATADTGWTFTGWSSACTANPCSITMDGDKSIIATFTKNVYVLTINKVGNGTVTPDKPAPYYHGDVVQLNAVADIGWVFTGWSGVCSGVGTCTLTMDDAKSVTATFRQELIKNKGFNLYKSASKIPASWVKNLAFGSTDGKDTKVKQEGLASVRMAGSVDKVKTLTQTLYLSGTPGQPFTFSYWVKASLMPKAGVCQGQVLFYNGKKLVGTKTLKCPTGKTYNWTQVTLELTAPPAYTKVLIKFTYSKSGGKVWFDWVSLLK
jgi:serine protease